MTTFAIERRQQYQIFEAPRWADILAQLWLVLIALSVWFGINWPKAEVWIGTRYDLARRRLGPFPPAHWRIAAFAVSTVLVFLWQDWTVGLLSKGLGAICVA